VLACSAATAAGRRYADITLHDSCTASGSHTLSVGMMSKIHCVCACADVPPPLLPHLACEGDDQNGAGLHSLLDKPVYSRSHHTRLATARTWGKGGGLKGCVWEGQCWRLGSRTAYVTGFVRVAVYTVMSWGAGAQERSEALSSFDMRVATART
jgi:hypothetical protein